MAPGVLQTNTSGFNAYLQKHSWQKIYFAIYASLIFLALSINYPGGHFTRGLYGSVVIVDNFSPSKQF